MTHNEGTTMRVGELARRAGLTVRTLHFYDEIGLLSPAGRTDSGYRMYGPEEALRLQQITSLRALGMPIERIKDMLGKDGTSAKDVLRMHMADLGERAQEMLELRDRLASIVGRLDDESPALEELLRTIQDSHALYRYFTREQIEALDERKEMLGRERVAQAQEEWKGLLSAFEAAMKAGDDPSCASVQTLARKALDLVSEFSGSDAGIEQAVAARYKAEGGANVMRQYGWDVDQAVFDYMGAAMRVSRTGAAPPQQPEEK